MGHLKLLRGGRGVKEEGQRALQKEKEPRGARQDCS